MVTWNSFPQVLIYVFDVESRELEKDMHYYQSCLEAILQVNMEPRLPFPGAGLVWTMFLVPKK